MKRWLVRFRKIGRIIPYVLSAMIVLAVAAAGVYEWKQPVLQKLRDKDPYRYDRMVDTASRLHWIDAWNQYVALQEISLAELYAERYRRWKQQWSTSAEFRQDVLRQKAETRDRMKQVRARNYARQKQQLKQFHRKPDPIFLRVHWEQATPWQKALMLRDRCIHYVSQELEDYRRRRHVKDSLHGASLLAQLRVRNASPGTLCREMVSLSHDERSVRQALGKLKQGMNYYYFSRLLADIGIPDSALFTVTGKLEGMTRDFNGF